MAQQIRDRMVADVVTVEPGTSVVDAARRMIEEKKGPLPVVEGDRVVAMVTDRDVIARVVAEGRDPNSLSVDDIATKELVTARPNQELDDARQLMAQHPLDRVLVTEEGDRLVGIISAADLRADAGPLAYPLSRPVGGPAPASAAGACASCSDSGLDLALPLGGAHLDLRAFACAVTGSVSVSTPPRSSPRCSQHRCWCRAAARGRTVPAAARRRRSGRPPAAQSDARPQC
jgi:CBS domain-containing protein